MESQASDESSSNGAPKYYERNRYILASTSVRDYNVSGKIWRYFTFEKFAWLLETSKLWHARLDQLGDPFEGSYPKGYVLLRDAAQLPSYLQRGLSVEAEKASNKCTPYACFATCWYAAERESEAMWKLYSTMHAGVAIVSTPRRMHQSVNLAPYDTGILGPIQYEDFETFDMLLRPISKSFGRLAYAPLLKRKSFEHENEVRGLIQDYSKRYLSPSGENLAEVLRKANPLGIAAAVDLDGLRKSISALLRNHILKRLW